MSENQLVELNRCTGSYYCFNTNIDYNERVRNKFEAFLKLKLGYYTTFNKDKELKVLAPNNSKLLKSKSVKKLLAINGRLYWGCSIALSLLMILLNWSLWFQIIFIGLAVFYFLWPHLVVGNSQHVNIYYNEILEKLVEQFEEENPSEFKEKLETKRFNSQLEVKELTSTITDLTKEVEKSNNLIQQLRSKKFELEDYLRKVNHSSVSEDLKKNIVIKIQEKITEVDITISSLTVLKNTSVTILNNQLTNVQNLKELWVIATGISLVDETNKILAEAKAFKEVAEIGLESLCTGNNNYIKSLESINLNMV
jgi:hypothetical protein